METPDHSSLLQAYRRYVDLIAAAIPPAIPFQPEAESITAAQVERATIFPVCVANPSLPESETRVDPLIDAARQLGVVVGQNFAPDHVDRLARIAVVDRAGHHRPLYRPLLIYAWAQAFRLVYESLPPSDFGRWEEGLWAWCNLLENELSVIDWPADGMPAARGAAAAESAWTALALHVAGKIFIRDAWTDLAGDFFGRLVRTQRPAGAWLDARTADNPETHWYHELAILHAAASHAVQSEDRPLAKAVAKNTEFHQNETQPDHATTQPWAVFAFVWNRSTQPLADQILHAAGLQHPGSLDGLSLTLLADALYCLRLFPIPADGASASPRPTGEPGDPSGAGDTSEHP